MSTARNRVQVMLNDETYDALVEAAKAEKRTVSDYVRNLLMDKLDTK